MELAFQNYNEDAMNIIIANGNYLLFENTSNIIKNCLTIFNTHETFLKSTTLKSKNKKKSKQRVNTLNNIKTSEANVSNDNFSSANQDQISSSHFLSTYSNCYEYYLCKLLTWLSIQPDIIEILNNCNTKDFETFIKEVVKFDKIARQIVENETDKLNITTKDKELINLTCVQDILATALEIYSVNSKLYEDEQDAKNLQRLLFICKTLMNAATKEIITET
eukprot:UN32396